MTSLSVTLARFPTPLTNTYIALLEGTDSWVFNIDRGYVNAIVFLDI